MNEDGTELQSGAVAYGETPEYTGETPAALSLSATNAVLKRISIDNLRELVNTPLSDDVMILDIDDNPRITIGATY